VAGEAMTLRPAGGQRPARPVRFAVLWGAWLLAGSDLRLIPEPASNYARRTFRHPP